MSDNKCIDLAADAEKFLRDKRVTLNKPMIADKCANALSKIRDDLRDYLSGNKRLDPQSMLSMCNVGLA